MCGILGTINQPFDAAVLNLIHHRGPDDSGILAMDVGEHRVTLGQTRLAIVDLSPAGHQPMEAPGEKRALVFNGEIYNHADLRRQLGGIAFRGSCDTETVLHWLGARGLRGLAALNGIFALAYMDACQGKLYLARDPFGVKPLYYYADTGRFVFSSEIKPIRNLVEDRLDVSHLAEVLRLRYSPSPDTLFEKIKKVRPGHVIEVDMRSGALAAREIPVLPEPPSKTTISFQSALETYGELFDRAVERQLMSDVEVAVLLSGGVDSALVAASAQRRSPRKMKAFTVGYAERDQSDEISDAAETAALLGLEHHVTRIGCDDFFGSFRKLISIVEEPIATTSIIPMFYLSELAARSVKVVLSGQGADESTGGYRRYQAEVIHDLIPPFIRRALTRLPAEFNTRNDVTRRALSSAGIADDVERFLASYSVFNGTEIENLIGRGDKLSASRLSYFYDLLQCKERRRTVERMMALDLRMNLADDLLMYTDKVTMHHSIECRVPLLDLELVRFIESLPSGHRVRLGRGKHIHKQFGRRVLPARIVGRRKKGFLSPGSAWFRRTGVLRELLLDRRSRFSDYFDLKTVERCLQEHESGHSRERHLFLLLSINYWMADFL